MILERNEKEILVRLSSSIDAAAIQDVLDFLRYKENSVKSEAIQSQVDELAESVNKSIWEKFKKERGL